MLTLCTYNDFKRLVVVNLPDRGGFDNITDKRDKRRLMVLGFLRWIVRPLRENVLSLGFWGIVNIITDSFLHCLSKRKHLLWKGRLQACRRKKSPKVRPIGRWGQPTHRISTPSLYCQQWFLRWSSSYIDTSDLWSLLGGVLILVMLLNGIYWDFLPHRGKVIMAPTVPPL